MAQKNFVMGSPAYMGTSPIDWFKEALTASPAIITAVKGPSGTVVQSGPDMKTMLPIIAVAGAAVLLVVLMQKR